MRITITLILLLIATPCFAERVYVDLAKGLEVHDLSDVKTIGDINLSHDGSFAEVTAEREAKKVQNKIEQQAAKQAKKQNKKDKEDTMKAKLGLSNSEWKDLQEALGVE